MQSRLSIKMPVTTRLTVKYTKVKDALDRIREGWIVFENGQPGVPFATKEQAIQQARAIAEIRGQSPAIVKVEDCPQ